MFENKKHVFWQAFFVTMLFFLLGLVFGVYLEQLRSDDLSMAFYDSEVSLYDSFALGELIDGNITSCENLKKASIGFADKIYNEARELERFDEKSKLTESMKSIHRKYDLLRTLLWINVIDLKMKCPMNSIVYLYIYDTEDIEIKSKQVVWERILRDVKEEKGNEVILIPIAEDQGIESLDYLLGFYNVDEFPAILINEKDVLYEHKTSEEIGDYLK
ncbi:hypothetical protein HYT25_03175 [Candidatus Pacearchaeota archaeon]|nr:hypothetical protein [Candidatus Pacearchaeota archaeon]